MSATKDKSWEDLEDGTFDVPAHEWSRSQAGARPAPDKFARTDVASGVSLGSRASTTKTVNQVAMFKCDACKGSGRFIRGYYDPRDYGPCNKCRGTGKLKTDPEKRAKQKKAREEIKRHNLQHDVSLWRAQHPAEDQWLQNNANRFEFAGSLNTALHRYGSLTEPQLAAIRRCMARDDERKKEREAQAQAAPQVMGTGFEKMLAAFAQAKVSGLKYPKLHVGEFTFALASERSPHNGKVLFVKHAEHGYMGRIELATARFFKSRDCGPDQEQAIGIVCSDPLAAAILHGKRTGRCSCCGRELENEESVRLGIGPVCREKWGL